jgi:hypothetical protein
MRRLDNNIKVDLIEQDVRMLTVLIWFRLGAIAGFWEHYNKFSFAIKT